MRELLSELPNYDDDNDDDALDDSIHTCHVRVRDVEAGSGLGILLDFTQDHPQSHLVATLVT